MTQAFYDEMAEILGLSINELNDELCLTDIEYWDSLAIVSTVAIVDRIYSVVLNGPAIEACQTLGDLKELIVIQQQKEVG